jgi:hypothetical protein
MAEALLARLTAAEQANVALRNDLADARQQLVATQQAILAIQQQLDQQQQAHVTIGHAKIPKPNRFSGDRRAETPRNWTYQMEAYLTATGVNLDATAAVEVAVGYLTGHALTWWLSHKQAVERNEAAAITTWIPFRDALIQRFTTFAADRLARDRLATLRQRTSVRDYAYEFNKCMIDLPDMAEKDRIHAFMQGLRPGVRVHVAVKGPTTVADAIETATCVDQEIWRARKGGNISDYSSRNHGKPDATPMELGAAESSPKDRPNVGGNPSAGRCRSSVRCYICKKAGHMARECRQSRRNSGSSN